MHAAGLRIFPWTINTRQEVEEMLALDVDGLICNDPSVVRPPGNAVE